MKTSFEEFLDRVPSLTAAEGQRGVNRAPERISDYAASVLAGSNSRSGDEQEDLAGRITPSIGAMLEAMNQKMDRFFETVSNQYAAVPRLREEIVKLQESVTRMQQFVPENRHRQRPPFLRSLLFGGSVLAALSASQLCALFVLFPGPVSAHQKLVAELQEENNDHYLAGAQQDYARHAGSIDPFDMGVQVSVQPRSTLNVAGTIRYPRSCRVYWVAFLEDGRVWPRLKVKNSGVQSQSLSFTNLIAVPSDFQGGSVVLLAVSDEAHEAFRRWIEAGQDDPLRLPSDCGVVLQTSLTIE